MYQQMITINPEFNNREFDNPKNNYANFIAPVSITNGRNYFRLKKLPFFELREMQHQIQMALNGLPRNSPEARALKREKSQVFKAYMEKRKREKPLFRWVDRFETIKKTREAHPALKTPETVRNIKDIKLMNMSFWELKKLQHDIDLKLEGLKASYPDNPDNNSQAKGLRWDKGRIEGIARKRMAKGEKPPFNWDNTYENIKQGVDKPQVIVVDTTKKMAIVVDATTGVAEIVKQPPVIKPLYKEDTAQQVTEIEEQTAHEDIPTEIVKQVPVIKQPDEEVTNLEVTAIKDQATQEVVEVAEVVNEKVNTKPQKKAKTNKPSWINLLLLVLAIGGIAFFKSKNT